MKLKTLLLLPLLGLFTMAFTPHPPATETIVIKTTIYCNHCKICETCGELLINQLYNEKGIKNVELDEKAMTIKVVYSTTKTTPDKIKQAIAALGYDADEVKAKPEAVAKLGGCCLKK